MDDKILRKPVLQDYGETAVTANSSTAYTVDLTTGNVFNITLTGNCTFTFSNPPASGTAGSFTLILTQDSTGGRTVIWPSAVQWIDTDDPFLDGYPSFVNVLNFVTVDAGTTWSGTYTKPYEGDASCSYVTSAVSASDLTTYTFSSQSLGTAASNRYIIVAVMARAASSQTISTATIAGVTATQLIDFGATNTSNAGFLIAPVPTGTTGDVVVTFTGAMVRCAIGVYRVVNLKSITPVDTATSEATPLAGTVDATDGGFVIGAVFSGGSITGITWTGATQSYVTLFGAWESGGNASCALASITADETNRSMQGDWTGAAEASPAGAFLSMR